MTLEPLPALRRAGAVAIALLLALPSASAAHSPPFTRSFRIEDCTFSSQGRNPFFVLEPGYRLVLEGRDKGAALTVTITVLAEVETIDGIETRVVEERETEDGALKEVSRNFFALCAPHNSVFYFGEEVDIYENGAVASHEGSWRAGVDGALPGVMMPGINLTGARYFQEIAPGTAMDRAEVAALDRVMQTPAGTFSGVMKVIETSPLEPGHRSIKHYAPGIGLIADGKVRLSSVSP